MDEKTLRFLRVMREQMRGKNSREVYSGPAAHALGMAPGYPEYEARLADLVRAEYLQPHPNTTMTDQGVYLITDRGSRRTLAPPSSVAQEEPSSEQRWWEFWR